MISRFRAFRDRCRKYSGRSKSRVLFTGSVPASVLGFFEAGHTGAVIGLLIWVGMWMELFLDDPPSSR